MDPDQVAMPQTTLARIGDPLSERELQVLSLVADGLTNDEIGSRLLIEASTVKFHIARLMTKLDARNRAHAAAKFARGEAPH